MSRNPSSACVGPNSGASIIELSRRRIERAAARSVESSSHVLHEQENKTPTLFLDFDGTLHVGRAAMNEKGAVSLNTGRPLFEFAPLLIKILEPYPSVRLVLTTSWLMTLPPEGVISLMPRKLARRVVDTTKRFRPRFGYLLNGSDRTYVICCYARSERLRNWLAVDDAVFGVEQFERTRGELTDHFLLLHSSRGVSDERALRRIEKWLVDTHSC